MHQESSIVWPSRLTLIRRIGKVAVCECTCGKVVRVNYHKWRTNHTRSCGCLRREAASLNITTHGEGSHHSGRISAEYVCWEAMKRRCSNPHSDKYGYYGGRGIAVCDRWRNSFKTFLQDMGRKPSSSYSIDRINVDGNYEPTNCRWATKSQQMRNRRQRYVA